MVPKKKLQVFVSSTYTDLRQERQAAVEAILTAGHIPAGMELFSAGDQSQMTVIKRWIDESDVFLLILGGRYGSIEPVSGKSYIHLEYEYALKQNKPLFAVVVDKELLKEKVKEAGASVIETENAQKLRELEGDILNRLVKHWSDPRDIKLAILETMAEFSRREELVGWVPGDQSVSTNALAEEMARLTKENADLREKLSVISNSSSTDASYAGLTFDEMYELLSRQTFQLLDIQNVDEQSVAELVYHLEDTANYFKDSEPNLLHFLWIAKDCFMSPYDCTNVDLYEYIKIDIDVAMFKILVTPLQSFGLVEGVRSERVRLTSSGRSFLLRLMHRNLNRPNS